MDATLTPAQLELQARARAFVRDVLQPLELDLERGGGRLPKETRAEVRDASIAAGLVGGSLPREVGGQGWSAIEQVLVHEQFGQSTGGSWSFIPGRLQRAASTATPSSAGATSIRRCAASASAATPSPSPAPGPTRERLAATAVRDDATGEYVLNGEKWFVTGPPDETDFMIFHCLVVDGDERSADAVPRRLRHARRDPQARPGLHAHVRRPASRSSCSRTSGCRRPRSSAGSAMPTT